MTSLKNVTAKRVSMIKNTRRSWWDPALDIPDDKRSKKVSKNLPAELLCQITVTKNPWEIPENTGRKLHGFFGGVIDFEGTVVERTIKTKWTH
jgi:hypothetical protein